LEELRKLYGTRGYLNFTSVPSTEPDVINRRIALRVDCDEGKQFRFGELILDGIEPYAGAGKQVLADRQPYRGRVFNTREFELFLARRRKLFGAEPRTDSRDLHDGSMNIVVYFDEPVAGN
jgi:outer membrane protein assembly factor BamA